MPKHVPVEGSSALLRGGGPLGKLAMALAAYEGGQKLWSNTESFYKDKISYTVTIDDQDHAYADVHQWLLQLVPDAAQRALKVTTASRQTIDYLDDHEDATPPRDVTLVHNDAKPKRVVVGGHRVTVAVKRPDATEQSGGNRGRSPHAIKFTCRTKEARDAVVDELRAIQARRSERVPVLRVVNQWGSWVRRSDLPPRRLETVILPAAQKEAVRADLAGFLSAEAKYARFDIPWHRGYMLHGAPGGGKTSLVKGLANEFGLDLWYVSLGDLKEESGLMNLLGEVGPRSVLLLEDVDTVRLTNDRSADESGGSDSGRISLSSLLNALDGVATPHGLVTFMTTNHFDRLDPALTRAGRMDRVEELAPPTWEGLQEAFGRFYGTVWNPPAVPGGPGLTMADVGEVFKRNLDDADSAAAALRGAVLEAYGRT